MLPYKVVLCFTTFSLCMGDIVSVTYDFLNENYEIHENLVNNWVAWANFTDNIVISGWSYLTVTTNGSYPDDIQAYGAGAVEGYITDDLIYKSWFNTIEGYCSKDTNYCDRLYQFINTNLGWMKSQIISKKNDPYWHQISLLLNQLAGLEDGYQRRQSLRQNRFPSLLQMEETIGFMMFQIFGDLEDLEVVLNKSVSHRKRVKGSGSCSALIKVLPGNEDLFVSQVSWNNYQAMLRILKRYNLFYHMTAAKDSKIIPGTQMTFSSYPGLLTSGDDFYLISSGLVTLETTIGNDNADLWKYVQPVGSVLEWMRSALSNRLAADGQTWTKLFIMFNSGTYNNQWMVVDFKLFKPKHPLQDNLLWVIEQIPKYYVSSDETKLLVNQSYWPSYNSPYFPLIYNMSGAYENALKFGDWFSYNKTPRALIFKRDHVKVKDLTSMLQLMRYNDYKNDPLAKCNCTPPYSAENGISARSDLNPKNGTYPFASLGHRSHGGIDAKITSFSDFTSNLRFTAVCGPTHDSQPVFQWSKSDFVNNTPHLGHPDSWNFLPVKFNGQVYPWK